MAITERTRDYETLIRYHGDGLVGAHHQQINEIARDGVVISASILPPTPIDPGALGELIGGATAQTVARNVELQAAVEAAHDAAGRMQAERDDIAQELAAVTAERDQLSAASERLAEQLAAAQAEAQRLAAEVESLAPLRQSIVELQQAMAELLSGQQAAPSAQPTDAPTAEPEVTP